MQWASATKCCDVHQQGAGFPNSDWVKIVANGLYAHVPVCMCVKDVCVGGAGMVKGKGVGAGLTYNVVLEHGLLVLHYTNASTVITRMKTRVFIPHFWL